MGAASSSAARFTRLAVSFHVSDLSFSAPASTFSPSPLDLAPCWPASSSTPTLTPTATLATPLLPLVDYAYAAGPTLSWTGPLAVTFEEEASALVDGLDWSSFLSLPLTNNNNFSSVLPVATASGSATAASATAASPSPSTDAATMAPTSTAASTTMTQPHSTPLSVHSSETANLGSSAQLFYFDDMSAPAASSTAAAASSTTAAPVPGLTLRGSRATTNTVDTSTAMDTPTDTALKRQRNSLAARKYRQKKIDRIAELEAQVDELQEERDALRIQLARQEAETAALREMLLRDGGRGRGRGRDHGNDDDDDYDNDNDSGNSSGSTKRKRR